MLNLNILYLNHICWEWILQRPQILALLLENDFDCTVVNKKFLLGKRLSKDNVKPKNVKKVYLLPKAEKNKIVAQINAFLYRGALRNYAKYDIIWVCYPELYKFIPQNYSGKIIYDCMDNHNAMLNGEVKKACFEIEQNLIHRADLIFITSEKLREVVPNLQSATLVRNGYRNNINSLPVKAPLIKEKYLIGYFGTISTWFDFKLLTESINKLNNIEYRLIGPVERNLNLESIENIPEIIFEGIVEHAELGNHVSNYDALIMPFKLNDIVLSVDPVKLYEYINLGKCIISIWYPEIARFDPYVYFYHNEKEYIELLEKLRKTGFTPKYNEVERNDFLKKNTWDQRYMIIKEAIATIDDSQKHLKD